MATKVVSALALKERTDLSDVATNSTRTLVLLTSISATMATILTYSIMSYGVLSSTLQNEDNVTLISVEEQMLLVLKHLNFSVITPNVSSVVDSDAYHYKIGEDEFTFSHILADIRSSSMTEYQEETHSVAYLLAQYIDKFETAQDTQAEQFDQSQSTLGEINAAIGSVDASVLGLAGDFDASIVTSTAAITAALAAQTLALTEGDTFDWNFMTVCRRLDDVIKHTQDTVSHLESVDSRLQDLQGGIASLNSKVDTISSHIWGNFPTKEIQELTYSKILNMTHELGMVSGLLSNIYLTQLSKTDFESVFGPAIPEQTLTALVNTLSFLKSDMTTKFYQEAIYASIDDIFSYLGNNHCCQAP